MREGKLISSAQLLTLMLTCRMFTVLTVVYNGDGFYGTDTLVAVIPAALLELALFTPVYLLLRGMGEQDMIACAYNLHPMAGKLSAVLLWAYCLFVTIGSALSFQQFLSYSAYPVSGATVMIILFSLATVYAASVGLEAVGRLSLYVCFALFLMLAFVGLALIPRYDMMRLMSPLTSEGSYPALIGRMVAVDSEILLIPLLLPLVRGKTRRRFVDYVLLSGLLSGASAFMVVASLGQFALSQKFPVYTAATMAEVSIWERMDSLYLVVWILLAFVKSALYLYLASRCFSYFVRWRQGHWALPVAFGLIGVFAVLFAQNTQVANQLFHTAATGIPLAVVLLGLPILLLLWRGLKHRRKGRDQVGES